MKDPPVHMSNVDKPLEGARQHWTGWDGPDPIDAESVKTLSEARRVFFSRKGPRFLLTGSLLFWGARALLGKPRWSDAAIAAGVVAYWPFQEWLVHKHLLHAKPRQKDGKTVDPNFAKRHRAHHRYPRDVDLALLPRYALVDGLPVHAAAWLLLSPTKRGAMTGLASLTTMTLLYEWTHYIVHTGYKPKNAFARRIRRNHRRHHFYNEAYWHTFIFPPVDTLLGTDPDVRAVQKSPTAQNLHGLDEDDEARTPPSGA